MVAAEGITILGLTVSTFSAFLLLGGLVGAGIAAWQGRAHGLTVGAAADLFIVGLIFALVLGRVLYVLAPPPSVARYYDAAWYLSHIFDFQAGVVAVWSGGFSRGGLLLGALAGVGLMLWFKRRHLSPHWLDALAWGCLAAGVLIPVGVLLGGQVYGLPSAFPLVLRVDVPAAPYAGFATFHPVPAYLSLWAALTALGGLLIVWQGGQQQPGRLGLALLIVFACGVFLIDFLTVDVARVLLLSQLQWVTLFGGGGAAFILLQQNRSN